MQSKKTVLMIIGALLSAAVAYQQSHADSNKKKSYSRSDYHEYTDALKTLWTRVYPNQGKTLYCGTSFSTKDRRARKKIANAEHVFPMSWATKDLKCGTRKQCQKRSQTFRNIESDLHNIYPAQIGVNKARSNFRFGEVAGEKRVFGSCDFEVNPKKRIAEPAPAIRGNIARAMLYMQYQHGLTLHRKTEQLMRQWDKKDPPDTEEKRREKIIRQAQGRENPFISRYPFKGEK